MALVKALRRQDLETEGKHLETECTYTIVPTPQGQCLQVDTYGSIHRQIPGKKSQSIRFAPEAIAELKEILARHFA